MPDMDASANDFALGPISANENAPVPSVATSKDVSLPAAASAML
ncbi:MAG: hypothetical protein NTV86_09905 [Planctomycetota bacterium]|nr:hypothetical protein [Planctomycetota bacterium]